MPKLEAELSASQEDYLKALYKLEEMGGATTNGLAIALKVSPASVSEMLTKLSRLELVEHDRYAGCKLTAKGKTRALEIVRHHRLLETFLVHFLNYNWDEVHEEAERLEHFISERMEEKIALAIGQVNIDPHGDPIPTLRGALPQIPIGKALTQCHNKEEVTVTRVSDNDSNKLRAIWKLGIRIGSRLQVLETSQFEGPITITLKGQKKGVPLGLAKEIFIKGTNK